MQRAEQSRPVVANARQSAVLANALRVRILMACAGEERSLSALQRQLQVPLAKLHYHVSRLLSVELLTVSRTQRRAGRPVRFYRAIGDSFLVPQERLSDLPGDKLTAQLRASLRDEHCRSSPSSLLYSSAPDGRVVAKLVSNEPAPPSRAFELWRTMSLSRRQRKLLAEELCDVIERFAKAPPERDAEALLVHAAFAPRP